MADDEKRVPQDVGMPEDDAVAGGVAGCFIIMILVVGIFMMCTWGAW